jgi:AcrR family transcriptional regulator
MAQPKTKQPRMKAPDRREQILDVTTELVAEHGFQSLSIEAVSARAGVTRALIYRHFADQQELLEAVVEREMERALAQVSETTLPQLTDGPPRDLMLESLHAYLHTVQTHPTTWRLVLTTPQGAPEILRKRIEDGRAAVLEKLIAAVRPALEVDPEPPDAELTARMLSAVADEYARLVLADPERFPPERLLAHAGWLLAQGQS